MLSIRLIWPMLAIASIFGCNEGTFSDEPPPPPIPEMRGVEGAFFEDRHTQSVRDSADILFVVDDSCSMFDDQEALAANFPRFIAGMDGSGLDYHIGVTTTDTDNPAVAGFLREASGVRFITEGTLNAEAVFGTMVRVGTGGSTTEKPALATWLTLEVNRFSQENARFYRPEAAIHTVWVTDEPEQTDEPITLPEFIRWYDGLKPNAPLRSLSAVIDPIVATNIPPIVEELGGTVYDIEDDWGDVLERLGRQAAGLRRDFFLSQIPVANTVDVRIERPDNQGGVVSFVPDGWWYVEDRNAVRFEEFIPRPDDVVVIRYQLRGVEGYVEEEG